MSNLNLKRDPALAALIEQYGPLTLEPLTEPDHLFGRLVRSVISQQISVKAAASIRQRLEASLPGAAITPESLHSTSFDDLRACGLSGQKAGYLLGLARQVSAGELVLQRLPELDDERVIAELTKVKGIGRWTAQMFLIFALGRPDVLPVGDLGFRTAIQRQYRLPSLPEPDEIERLAELWRPYCSYAALYLWKSLNNTPQS